MVRHQVFEAERREQITFHWQCLLGNASALELDPHGRISQPYKLENIRQGLATKKEIYNKVNLQLKLFCFVCIMAFITSSKWTFFQLWGKTKSFTVLCQDYLRDAGSQDFLVLQEIS